MKGLVSTLMEKDDVLTIINGIEEGLKEQLVTGLSGSSRHLFAACLYKKMIDHYLL